MTRVAVLTPAGTGAIATVEVSGPRAWELARELFRPAGKPLPAEPELHRFWFGTLGGDEVILAVTGPETIEVHCHGGVRVVRMVVEQFTARGCILPPLPRLCGGEGWGEGVAPERRDAAQHPLTLYPSPPQSRRRGKETSVPDPAPILLIQRAPTLRTAAILLDQFHGAFDREVARILGLLDTDPEAARDALRDLARRAPVGRHLVEPWKVVVAGAPNVGKSSLVNALAGFQRAVVSEVAGTTRDVVSVQVAFDGWPVELTDTAGLRESEGLEAEGVERAKRALATADLVVWVMDGTADRPLFPDPKSVAVADLPVYNWVLVVNKIDQPAGWDFDLAFKASEVSVVTGAGISTLVSRLALHLVRYVVPDPPPGAAVPYTPRLADLVQAAWMAFEGALVEEARRLLRVCLERPG